MENELTRRDFLKATGAAGAALAGVRLASAQDPMPPEQEQSAAGLRVPPIEVVRVGFVGVGARGAGHVEQFLLLDGVEVKAICDIYEPAAKAAADRCERAGRPRPDLYTQGDYDYHRMLNRDDIDIVVISTPWDWHVQMSVDTMLSGKHAFVEVPAATTVEGCWELVETAEQTQRHCMMMENVCYGREELLVLNMCRQGVFGELLHGEAAYIHDLRYQMHDVGRGTGSWRTVQHTKRNGNLYPTHGLGPICQYMNINRGDRMDYLVSMSSPALGRALYAKEHFPPTHIRNRERYICGDINSSLVKTVKGRTILIQWDTTTPRPYTRLNLIQGTKGVWAGFPNRVVVEGISPNTHTWEQGDALNRWFDRFEHPLWKRIGEEAKRVGGHGGMDFVMLWRIVYCLRNGLPMDQDVYDAATWSVIGPLSEWSVARRSQPIEVPDFTRGKWKTMEPLGIVS
jgi:hypothetical protein